MINRIALLSDLQKLLQRLEADLLERSESVDVPDVGRTLRAEFERAKSAERTAQNFEDWRSDSITQHAAAWVLSCVFVRFLEDNQLIDPPRIAGSGDRLQRARDEWELFLSRASEPNERDYLMGVFDELAKLPGTKDLFGEHNPIRELPNWLSGDAAKEQLAFFQKIDANTEVSNKLIHDFTDAKWDTRFLGDLYQDLSEAARKKYALLQTPEFVEEFILERTLEPALDEFSLDAAPVLDRFGDEVSQRGFRMIDPACGSGHFLLGSFRRILERWQRQEPGSNVRTLVQRTLDSIHGVDVNPFAVAIARFRLMLMAMGSCGIARLDSGVPEFKINLACGDSLIHGPGSAVQNTLGDWTPIHHAYQPEDLTELRHILQTGYYHAVVANPPYITPKDRALNEKYRKVYPDVCHMKYSLAVPFMARLFRLAVRELKARVTVSSESTASHDAETRAPQSAGYVGQITANSFMKREFGKKLIESFFPTVDLTHVIDTAGAYIPGHGTPTVILFGRHRPPMASTLRTAMGIRGEPSTPDKPACGMVWSAIITQLDQPGSQSEFVSVGDSPRETFHKHPWSVVGGGASELKDRLDEVAESGNDESKGVTTKGGSCRLEDVSESIGITAFTLEDEIFLLSARAARRHRMLTSHVRTMVIGDAVRDWQQAECDVAVFPYDATFQPIQEDFAHPALRYLWLARTSLANGKLFGGKTKVEGGLKWFEFGRLTAEKLRTPLSIVFPFVATHNNFRFDRGSKVFNRTAQTIKLPPAATEDDYLSILGTLNTSVICFLLKQVGHNKGDSTDQHGARTTGDPAFNTYEYTAGMVAKLPLPAVRPSALAKQIDSLAERLAALSPDRVLPKSLGRLRESLRVSHCEADLTRALMIAAQEELDWECYRLYGLIADDLTLLEPPPLKLGQRAFEIVLARKIEAGQTQTTWFKRHGSTPITELPAEWPDDYRQLIRRRIDLIESDPNIRLIEQPEYKRRWNTEPWDSQIECALREWLLDQLESYFDFDGRMNDAGKPTARLDIAVTSIAKLADVARHDAEFLQVGELYRDDAAFDVQALVSELVAAECVPLLPVLRYKPSGLIKRTTWERTWDLQRQEDTIDARTTLPTSDPEHLSEDAARDLKRKQVGNIPLPTKYDSKDFFDSNLWRLRGKLDVPKERWVSFPHCEGPDGTLVIAWAGYDHLQLAKAISAYFVDVQERLGGRDDPRLIPLLSGVIELLPLLKQWHNDTDPEFNQRMGDFFEGWIAEEARQLGLTIEQLKAWEPPKKVAKGRVTRAKKAKQGNNDD